VKRFFILAAFAATLGALPAQAQPVAADLMPAYEVTTIIASMGMRPVGRPAWMRGRYVVAAIDRHGREVNVVLDARDGQVIAVRPLGRNSFGAPPPPPGYGPQPAPYDPMVGTAPPPDAMPGAPPADDGEFFDNERQESALPPSVAPRSAPRPQSPASTGSVPRAAPAERRDAARQPAPKASTPMPRPRPALARANDPGNLAAQPAEKPAAVVTPGENRADGKKSAKRAADPAAADSQAVGAQAAKPEPAAKPEAKKNIRVIDLSKPKSAAKPEDKPGEAIRF
jgi:hypothetical protein